MKKLTLILICVLCAGLLCSCGIEESEVRAYLEAEVAETPYENADAMQRALSASYNKKVVKETALSLLEGYIAEDDLTSVMRLIRALEQGLFRDEDVRRTAMVYKEQVKEEALSGQRNLADYLFSARECLYTVESDIPDPSSHIRYYFLASHLYEYEELEAYALTLAEKPVIWSLSRGDEPAGGYYAQYVNSDEYKYESYWYSPLDNARVSEGFVGTYRVRHDYELAGDFLLESGETYWYETDASDPNNSEYKKLYYKGVLIEDGTAASEELYYDLLLGDAVAYELRGGESPVLLLLIPETRNLYGKDTSAITILTPNEEEGFTVYKDY